MNRDAVRSYLEAIKKNALEWAVTTVLTLFLPAMYTFEDVMAAWIVTVDPVWVVRFVMALVTVIVGWAIWTVWTVPRLRFDASSGTYNR